MRTLAITVAITALAVPALAQQGTPTPQQLIDEAKRRENAQVESQYESHSKRTKTHVPDARHDPWATMRAPTGAKDKEKR